ncbi:MAG: hypothetical protein GF364_15150 [Candidatus Lokiarchaeota archaeon]|nr:hypothetical protein [Candidatus Lokiarchaeota archaeon]
MNELPSNLYIETVCLVVLLAILSLYTIIDLKYRKIRNKYIVIPFLFGILKTINETFSIGVYYLISKFLILIILSIIFLFFYFTQLIGAADFKVIMIIFLIRNPILSFGITPCSDILQFIMFFSLCFLIIPLATLSRNCIEYYKSSFLREFSFSEKVYIFLFTKRQSLVQSNSFVRIILRLNIKNNFHKLHFEVGNKILMQCLTVRIFPVLLLINVSFIISIIV